MIRKKTTFVIGAGAATELAMPSNEELLLKVGQTLDFSRLGTPTQSRDTVVLAHYFNAQAMRLGHEGEAAKAAAHAAADRIKTAAKLAKSLDAVIDQHDADPLSVACGKLSIIHFLCQAEAKSILRQSARVVGDLPIQGTETWLWQFGQLVTNGVPRSQAESCLDDVSLVSFCFDRSVEHFLPHAIVMAFGMPLEEAQALVSERLRIIHPFGSLARLPWQAGPGPAVEWGTEQPGEILDLVGNLRTSWDVMGDAGLTGQMSAMVGEAERLVFLGFGFQPQNLHILSGSEAIHEQEIVATGFGLSDGTRSVVTRALRRGYRIAAEDGLLIVPQRANDFMRDYSLLLEG